MIDKNGYRLNVGVVLVNQNKQLFWGKRVGNDTAWQFPQGGVNAFETLHETVFRELAEEVGLQKNDVEIIGVSKRWLYYDIPNHLRRLTQTPPCIGQKQKWFLLQLGCEDEKIRLDHSHSPEFDKWRWVDYWYPLSNVIYFKRDIYRNVLEEFAPIIEDL
jgi:putative (di)nucleoside polyphosphate hydrolase